MDLAPGSSISAGGLPDRDPVFTTLGFQIKPFSSNTQTFDIKQGSRHLTLLYTLFAKFDYHLIFI